MTNIYYYILQIGCDRSFNLIQLCKEKDCKVFTCNCLNVPLKDESADAVISIAVIHHLANEVYTYEDANLKY